ncbi:MAG: Hsp70 family protein [Bacteroidaceae bacterium]|nr:Hsp70 family protein [Bacteroidales bacterium]MBQ2979186.1 Hsp70 family protein [Bacteroidaceae bacterium]
MADDKSRAVYGIDLGTTYSCISQVDKYDQAVVLRNFEGDSTTPSVVYFESESNMIVGKEAKNMLPIEPEKTVSFIKRQIGNDEAFDKTKNTTPFHCDPVEISALILKKLVKDANDMGENPEPIKDVVITCPAYFGNKERLQTKQAGISAGLNVLAIINEPTAAAISYGLKVDERRTILVYDLGGGTFDVTIIVVNGGAIKVIATGGDHHLGGVDWDTELAKYVLNTFNQQNGTSYDFETLSPNAKYDLLLSAEGWKKNLTARQTAKINFSYEGKSVNFDLPRETFNAITEDRLNETIDATRKIIDIAKEKGYNTIDEIILVGGSSKMPQIKERVEAEFGLPTHITDPDECVAKGAAIFAMNEAYDIALKKADEGEGPRPMPLGTSGRTRIVNVTSKTYGLGLIDNQVGNMIFANSTLPVSRTRTFETVRDGQTGVTLPIYESDFTDEEKDRTVEDRFCNLATEEIQELKITGNHPKGTEIQVTFSIDNEGILSVNATRENDVIDFKLKVAGVKNEEELKKSQNFIANATV